MRTRTESTAYRLALLALVVNLTGCATTSPPLLSVPQAVSVSPRLPAPDPRLMEPPPDPQALLATVLDVISQWANSLPGSPSK